MADTQGPRQNTIFTYGLGLACGLPRASWISEVITQGMGEITSVGTLLALTLGFGATGAAVGYAIDRVREGRDHSDG